MSHPHEPSQHLMQWFAEKAADYARRCAEFEETSLAMDATLAAHHERVLQGKSDELVKFAESNGLDFTPWG